MRESKKPSFFSIVATYSDRYKTGLNNHRFMRGAPFRVGDPKMSIRPVKRLSKSKPVLEGAGVRLRRAFGFGNTSDFDPFLLLDDFRNDIPEDYLAGFPWHPH